MSEEIRIEGKYTVYILPNGVEMWLVTEWLNNNPWKK